MNPRIPPDLAEILSRIPSDDDWTTMNPPSGLPGKAVDRDVRPPLSEKEQEAARDAHLRKLYPWCTWPVLNSDKQKRGRKPKPHRVSPSGEDEFRCARCRKWFTRDRFAKSANATYGVASYCRPCAADVWQANRQKKIHEQCANRS